MSSNEDKAIGQELIRYADEKQIKSKSETGKTNI